MAAITTPIFSSPLISPITNRTHNSFLFTQLRVSRGSRTVSSTTTTRTPAMGNDFLGDFLGDFGARDPFPAELESNFSDKVLGNVNTEHKILIPTVTAMSLSQQDCAPISPLQSPMSEDEAQQLLRKVIGWKLINEEGRLKLQCLWKLRDFESCVELINRIFKVVEPTGHFPNIHLEQPNHVRAELCTALVGGLSMNDFIVAAKIDDIKTSDLVPRKRVWA